MLQTSWLVWCMRGLGCRGELCEKGPLRRSKAGPSTANLGLSKWLWQWGWKRHLMLSGLWNPVGISKGIISTFGRLSEKGGAALQDGYEWKRGSIKSWLVQKYPCDVNCDVTLSLRSFQVNEWSSPCTVCSAGQCCCYLSISLLALLA